MREYAKKPFTDLTVRSLEEGYHFDGKMPRFGIWVGKNRRTWIVLRGPRSDKIKIGGYPRYVARGSSVRENFQDLSFYLETTLGDEIVLRLLGH
jgi:hypothetical protein